MQTTVVKEVGVLSKLNHQCIVETLDEQTTTSISDTNNSLHENS